MFYDKNNDIVAPQRLTYKSKQIINYNGAGWIYSDINNSVENEVLFSEIAVRKILLMNVRDPFVPVSQHFLHNRCDTK